MLDLGTGDGRFVLDQARTNPQSVVVGVDASASAMEAASRRAAAKPSRGGVENAQFVHASVEALPAEFEGVADRVTINYPWSRLLRILAMPDTVGLAKIAGLLRPNAELQVLVNIHPFHDAALTTRLGLSGALLVSDTPRLRDIYACTGLRVDSIRRATEAEARVTSWGKELFPGGREIWRINATRSA